MILRYKILIWVCFLPLLCLQSVAENPNGNLPVEVQRVKMFIVSGKVIDKDGQPLPGVNIRVKNTDLGTITRADGSFHVSVSSLNKKLIFTYVGYLQTEQTALDKMIVTMNENAQILSEIIVTTQKQSQSSIDVPTAVSAISGLNLRKMNIQQFDEMANYIPGLQIQLQSPNNPGYVIRGVTSDDGASYSQPRVSVFQDGVSISRSRASVVQLYDLERVEVAKGPQGTLFGRGAEIGGIHVIRNKPVDYFTGELSLGFGTYNKRMAEGFLNTPIIKGKLANRFAFSYEARDGFIKNEAGGRLNGQNTIALRNSVRLFANDNTTYDLIGDYQYDNYPGTSFRTENEAYGSSDPNAPANLEQGKNLYIHRHVGGLTFLANHQINENWKLSAITGYRAFDSDESFDADGTPAYLLWCEEKEKGKQFSQEFRFHYDNKKRFSGFFGTSYFYENSSQNVIVRSNLQQLFPAYAYKAFAASAKPSLEKIEAMLPALSSALPTTMVAALQKTFSGLMDKWFPSSYNLTDSQGNPTTMTTTPDFYGDLNTALKSVTGMDMDSLIALANSMGTGGASIATLLTTLKTQLSASSALPLNAYHEENSTNYGTNQAAEVFADGSFKLLDGLKMTIGLRGTYEHQRTGYESSTVADPVFGVLMYHPTTDGRVNVSKDYYSWVGRAALNYMYKRNNIYVSISRGRRPGVIAFNNDPHDISKLKPEIIISYETGIKGMLLNGKLNYEFATYYYNWNHFQTNRFDEAQSKYIADDAGRAHTFGIETSLRYAPTRFFNVFGNYSYIDGCFNNTDENGIKQEYAGNRFRLTPKHSFALGLNINIPMNTHTEMYFIPSYSYKSKVYFEDSNEENLSQKGYGLANFTAGFRFHPKNIYYEIAAFGKNVFDTKYIIDAGNSGRTIGFPTYVGGTRSVVGLRFKMGL